MGREAGGQGSERTCLNSGSKTNSSALLSRAIKFTVDRLVLVGQHGGTALNVRQVLGLRSRMRRLVFRQDAIENLGDFDRPLDSHIDDEPQTRRIAGFD